MIGGPQNSGLILGKRALVEACVLLGSPSYAIGRPMEVGKEDMVGLLVALECYLERGEKEQRERCEACTTLLVDGLGGVPASRVRRQFPNAKVQPLPEAVVEFDERRSGLSRDQIVQQLAKGAPRIEVGLYGRTGILINPDTLKEGDVDLVIRRLRAALTETTR